MFVDSHTHLFHPDLVSRLNGVMGRARSAGVEKMICVGTDLSSSEKSLSIASRYVDVFASVGVHPHDAGDAPSGYLERLRDLAAHPMAVALGEIGLDFFRPLSPRGRQKEVFARQLELAAELDLPVIVHCRNATNEVLDVVESSGCSRGVIHCFSGTPDVAKRFMSLGFLISFAGNVTFPPTGGKHRHWPDDLLREVPLESVMLETDSPFLAPVPVRGRVNEPAHIPHIAGAVARAKGITAEEVGDVTSATARRFFGLPE